MPPAFHRPSCLPRHGFVRSFGADSAKAPQVTHQKVGPLTTVRCFLPAEPDARVTSSALAAQLLVAVPGQGCGARVLQFMDLVLQTVHHQPSLRRSMRWPPSLCFLAMTVLCLPVCGLSCVGQIGRAHV